MAGGASGLVAIARELGGDDRVVAVVQYLRVALITASMPVVVTLVYHAERSPTRTVTVQSGSAPWYLSVAMLVVIVLVGATGGRLIRLPGAGLLGPMAITIALELTGFSFGLWVPIALVQLGYAVIGWQAGLAFTRESVRAIGRHCPTALGLIVVLNVALPASACCWPTSRASPRWRATCRPAPAASTQCWPPPSRPDRTSRSSSPRRWCGCC